MIMPHSNPHPEETPPPIFRTWTGVYVFVLAASFVFFLLLLWLSLSYQ